MKDRIAKKVIQRGVYRKSFSLTNTKKVDSFSEKFETTSVP